MNYRSTKLGVILLLVVVFVMATFAPVMAAGCPGGSCGYGQITIPNYAQGQCACSNGQCSCPDGQCTCPDGQCTCPECSQNQCGPQGCGNPFLNRILQNGRYTGCFGNSCGNQMPFGGGFPMQFGGGCMSGSCGR